MKTKSKTIGIICLAIIMLVSCCGLLMDNMYKEVTAGAAEQTEESLFEIQNGMIINYRGDTTGTVEIPSSINGETVQGLAANSFRSKLLTEVVIPETVTTISARAFFDCRMLQTITWESGTASLSIAAGAFNRCPSLESITIPARVTSLSATAFTACNSLSNIYVEEGNTVYKNGTNGYEGVVFLTTAIDDQSKDAAYIWPTGKKPYEVQHIIGMAGYEVETVIGPAGYTYTLPQAVGPYTVEGWYTKADYSSGKLGETYTIAETEQDVYTIYARLSDGISEQAYISFDTQGGELGETALNPCPVEEDTDYTAYIPERKGYDFAGWYSLPAKQGKKVINEQGALLEQEALKSQTLYAGWTAQRYTINYYEYNGSFVTSATVDYESAIDVVIRARTGYTFVGWYTEQELSDTAERLTNEKGVFLPGTWRPSENRTLNLYAHYNANKYSITFICTFCGKQVVQEVYYDDTLVLPEICIHAGYRLNGWTETEGGTVKYNGDTVKWTYASDKTLYTVWEAEVYTITYKDGNTVIADSGNPASYTVEDSITFNAYAPTGYNFVNWLDEEGNVVTGIAKGSTGDRIIYLEKEAKPVTIKFDYRGAYNEETQQVDYGEEFTLPDKTLGDYPEIKWKDTMTGSIYSSNTGITVNYTEERTYQAIWTASVTLHYPEGETESVNLTYGEDFELPADERTMWIFHGWAKTEGGDDFVTDANGKSLAPFDMTTNFHLYAIYEGEEITVTFDKQGGTGGSSQIKVKVGEALPTVDINGNRLAKPTLTAQKFLGYYTEPDGDEQIYDFEMRNVAGNWSENYPKTLYAKWDDQEYTVELYTEDEDGDEVLLDTVLAFYMKNLPAVDKPERPGYDFMGFYDSNGQQYYTADMKGLIWDKASGGELYAEWEVHYYTVKLSYTLDYGTTGYDIVEVAYGELMPTPTFDYAYGRDGYAFDGYYSKANGGGTKYYGMRVEQDNYTGHYSEKVVPVVNKRWDIYGDATLYANWKILTCRYECDNVWLENGYLEPTYYDLEHGCTLEIEEPPTIDGYVFQYFWRDGVEYTTDKFPIAWTMNLERSMYTGEIGPRAGFFAVYIKKEDSGGKCVAAGTMITLADGRQVPVETLTGNEMLLVWNLQTGKFDVAPMVFIDSDPAALYKVINLYFSDGTQMKVISEHGFWDLNLNRYVYLREDAAKYIGHWFSKQGTNGLEKVQLVNVVVREEYTTAWSPVTYGHLCYFVNGMLSMPGGIDGLFNIFEVNPETMMYDMEQMQADIAQYGLYTYEEFAAIFPVPEEIFNAFNAQYFKVAIGKGMLTLERVGQLIERYAEFF